MFVRLCVHPEKPSRGRGHTARPLDRVLSSDGKYLRLGSSDPNPDNFILWEFWRRLRSRVRFFIPLLLKDKSVQVVFRISTISYEMGARFYLSFGFSNVVMGVVSSSWLVSSTTINALVLNYVTNVSYKHSSWLRYYLAPDICEKGVSLEKL
ncbi:uncharacterized protein H6S33_007057 [Morchella sextelata]|uniref:uncharacterized protein n=1 Tax=Morchella sextelata TaxID=1174677 RepID=UPI001D049685|nr:uncharacterized protein H6S33_007057 [Morchella sextelata]KAH0604026.1 hypothetical protein H6S33_007057 [Morchella sextelata]